MDTDNKPIPADVLVALSQTPEVVKAVRELAKDIAKDARLLAPKRTGNLRRRGIGIERIKDPLTGAVAYAVGWTPAGWYGHFVEFGTEHSRARPHLVPAAIKHNAERAGE